MSTKAKFALIAALLGAMLAGGAVGLALFGPGAAGAQSTTPTAKSSPAASPGTFKSDEDAAHEKGETAAEEADENAGRGHHGRGMHACAQTSPAPTGANKSCEDPAHEKGESAAREADEDAGRAGFQHRGADAANQNG